MGDKGRGGQLVVTDDAFPRAFGGSTTTRSVEGESQSIGKGGRLIFGEGKFTGRKGGGGGDRQGENKSEKRRKRKKETNRLRQS